MTALLATPAAQLGFSLIGISPPPPFPSAYDAHITSFEQAGAQTKSLNAHADDALWRMVSRNEASAVEACRTRLTAEEGPLRSLEQLAADCGATVFALEALRITSTATWAAIGLFAAAVGVAAATALFTGAPISLPGLIARARQLIAGALRRFGAILQKLFKSLLDRIVGRRYVNLKSAQMTEQFAASAVFRKKAVVGVRDAREGEKIHTVLADGTKETVNKAKKGDKIITNPRGEEYIITAENFAKRYDDIGEGMARAKGTVRAFQNPVGKPVTIDAPWGERMDGDRNAWFMMAVDPKKTQVMTDDRYIIGSREFREDYELWSIL
ncbi:PGDYG domain-containing protein [Streptosporangium sp. CA-135522]|uniref:PGDYG domain-containing protein n=1 Tax=Streptosporangium sp. CA-135522 TaxID=3240072 RepID=UPI003D93024C